PLARVDYRDYDYYGDVANWNVVYYHNNPIGTPIKTSNHLGQISWSAQLDPFGKATPVNPAITQNLRFPGQYYDQETGLHYNMARYYDPAIGRYLQSDPIGLSGGINTYTYVRNNPVNRIDPLGLYDTLNCSVSQCAQIADAVAAAQNAANQQGIGNEVSKTLDNTTFQCRKPDKAKNYCAANNDPTIYLRNAFNAKKCGPLESTVLHEVSHSAPLNYSEMDAFLLENKAFGTSIPTPEQLQSDYPNLSPEQIQYYRNQTNGVFK
ncbi:RHS repeat-associated core domain-containing protein, partial [Methylomonas subterranea]|uniref:RHS repeat-associated core domain-containing protein n=1 Tax=Methylomonas subterranea TaxID=2952225 RepID=UPI00273CD988